MFEKDKMYKNLLKDQDVAFIVDEILSDDHNGADLMVTWFKKDKGRYIGIGVSGEYHIPKVHIMHYMEI